MITFHNDHLVSPVLCELLYNTVDERLHRPVIFVPSRSDSWALEVVAILDISKYICTRFSLMVGLGNLIRGKYLLSVAYHEFGHIATAPLIRSCTKTGCENRKGHICLRNNWPMIGPKSQY